MTTTKVRSKVCPSCRAGQCADCTRALTCECQLDHASLRRAPMPLGEELRPLPRRARRRLSVQKFDYGLSGSKFE